MFVVASDVDSLIFSGHRTELGSASRNWFDGLRPRSGSRAVRGLLYILESVGPS